MEHLFEKVKENVYVLATWDSSWNSYNNCYLIVQEDGVILIDSGKKEHADYLEQALNSLGKSKEDVTLFLATHGHEDHVQSAAIFTNAMKYIHPNDRNLIDSANAELFNHELPDRGGIHDFDCLLVGLHTPGSVALYHRPSKVLFVGDFLCFFGDPLSKDGLVSEGNELRLAWLEFLQGGGVAKDQLNSFLNGLDSLSGFNADIMCTGHGGVLVGEIENFITELLEAGALIANN